MFASLTRVLAEVYSEMTLKICLVIIVLATAAGPFGTYEVMNFGARFVFWATVVLVSNAFGQCSVRLARRLAGEARPLLSDLIMTSLMAAAFTPFVFFLIHEFLLNWEYSRPNYLEVTSYVTVVTAGICVFRRILPGFEDLSYFGRSKQVEDPAPEPDPPRLLRRLPDDFEGPVLHMTVRDHFVDVITATQTYTIRQRFADAIAEMDTVEGYCTHRSHWGACAAIIGVERDSGRIYLRLTNGDLVPVSRKYRAELECAGVLMRGAQSA